MRAQFQARPAKNITTPRTVEHNAACSLSIESSSRIFPDAQGNLDGIHQLRTPEWLDEECDWMSTQGKSSGPVARVRRNQNYRKSAAGSTQSLAELHAAHFRQVDIDYEAGVRFRQIIF